jgi:NAD-dependent deacetylase
MTVNQQVTISARLRKRFAEARRVLVLTGAGVSAESGVPTFRGGGQSAVWKGMPFDKISSAGMLERNLREVWEWFNYRRDVIEKIAPNPAHHALARWQTRFDDFTLVTQNVDGLHQAAGSRDVVELHGNIWRARCTSCSTRYDLRDRASDASRTFTCPDCESYLRPDVVLFGEMLPAGAFERAAAKARSCQLCFVVGTSALVYPAAGLPEIAKSAGAYTVEVNTEPTPLSGLCDEVIQSKAGEVLPLFL